MRDRERDKERERKRERESARAREREYAGTRDVRRRLGIKEAGSGIRRGRGGRVG
jgi:hypothetical protein